MKLLTSLLLAALSALPLTAAEKAAGPDPAAVKANVEMSQPRWVVILGVYKEFQAAKGAARHMSIATKIPFSMNGNVFDQKGLHFPEDLDDPAWAGQYLARRSNHATEKGKDLDAFISVERSDGYEGFVKGFYIIVGTIAETQKAGMEAARELKQFAPDTYVKKTRIWMGCLH